jgi:branched-subunit amino acid transport protein
VVPEVVMVNGHLIDTWKDARLYAGIVGAGVYFWRKDVLFTIVAGMAVYMPLHLGLGW